MPGAAGVVIVCALVAVVHQACDRDFPAQPTPFANSPLTTLSGTTFSGSAMVGGSSTSFNMTLIARSLGLPAARRALTQEVGSVRVTGNFETGAGVSGTVDGQLLTGTLRNGDFLGDLVVTASAAAAECTREFSGRVSDAGVVWAQTQPPAGCPLPDRIDVPRAGTMCTFTLSASQTTFGFSPGKALLTVTTSNDCAWRAESSVTWIHPAPDTQVGSVTTAFTVDQNPSTFQERQGVLRVWGESLTIRQLPTQIP
jgi:hypothetical protein